MWGTDYVKDFDYVLRGSPTGDIAKNGKDKKQKQYHWSENANIH